MMDFMQEISNLYLHNVPKDFRTWSYSTYNLVSQKPSKDCLEIIEDPRGDIFIEKYVISGYVSFCRISNPTYKSVKSDSVKSYRVK